MVDANLSMQRNFVLLVVSTESKRSDVNAPESRAVAPPRVDLCARENDVFVIISLTRIESETFNERQIV